MEGYQKFIAFNGMARYFFFRLGYAWTHEYVMLSLSINGLVGYKTGCMVGGDGMRREVRQRDAGFGPLLLEFVELICDIVVGVYTMNL